MTSAFLFVHQARVGAPSYQHHKVRQRAVMPPSITSSEPVM